MDDEPTDLRDVRVVIYMTRDDADYLTRHADRLGFKSRSTLVVAILERLVMGGFSVASFVRVGWQFLKRAEEACPDQLEFSWEDLRSVARPLPALPVEDDPTPKEVRRVIGEIREELTKQQNAC